MIKILPMAKHRKSRVALIMALLIWAVGCSTPNITKDRSLDNTEGILIARVHSNMPKVKINVVPRDSLTRSAILHGPKEYLVVIPIKSGEARFSSLLLDVSAGFSAALRNQSYFSILPGTATYVGDIFINWTFEDPGPWSGRGWVQFEVHDREDETVAAVKKEYPWILDKYPYRKSIPFYAIETEKSYKELPEIKELKERIRQQEEQEKLKEKREKSDI